jgi:hypothetical protein
MRPLLRSAREPYQYEREVEEFLRWSPSVRRTGVEAGKSWRPSPRQIAELQKALAALGEPAPGPPTSELDRRDSRGRGSGYDELDVAELVALLPSLERSDLQALARHEEAGRRRREVLDEIDRLLTPSGSSRGP